MGDEHKFPSALEIFSPGSPDYWFPKFVMGGPLLYFAFDSFRLDHPASIVPCGLILSLSLTFLLLTRIKPEAEEQKYRRLFEWKAIPYSEIIGCSTFWIWGFIKTKQYRFPFGRIYFPLPHDQRYGHRWDKGIISFIRSKAGLD
jgi:hypothetical protein